MAHPTSVESDAPPADSALTALGAAEKTGFINGLVDRSSALVAVFRQPDLEVVYLNAAGRQILDPEHALSGTGLSFGFNDIIGVTDGEKFKAQVLPLVRVTGSWSGRIGLRDLWGSEFWAMGFLCEQSSDREPRGSYLCLEAMLVASDFCDISSDSTDRDFLAALLNSSADCIYFKDRQSRFLRTSRSQNKKFGYSSPHEVIGRTDFDFFSTEHASQAYADEQRIIASGEPVIDKEERETWVDADDTWVSSSKMPLLDREGNIVGTFGISHDITHRKRAEKERQELQAQLQLAQKLESIGSLAAGVAHEINTPTQFVSDNVKFLADSFSSLREVLRIAGKLGAEFKARPENSPLASELIAALEKADLEFVLEEIPGTFRQTEDGLSRVARIVKSLKEFAHPGSPEKVATDINAAIETTINVARHEWKYVADVVIELDETVPEIFCMSDEINQVLLNLIVNAAHAVGATNAERRRDKGTITVRTRADDSTLVIEIIDDGGGMPTEIQPHVFEPFFTTKRAGLGTGQGLAIVQKVVVKNHGGQVEFDSEPDHGTTFRILLPVNPVSPEELSAATQHPIPPPIPS